ncbi:hypothetical protein EDC04DRAFT_944607 [Pisolithus marmoratus]|nr:hypothetical protein EDC04DRAFT_944607 [Pisolithus marmoratus]
METDALSAELLLFLTCARPSMCMVLSAGILSASVGGSSMRPSLTGSRRSGPRSAILHGDGNAAKCGEVHALTMLRALHNNGGSCVV